MKLVVFAALLAMAGAPQQVSVDGLVRVRSDATVDATASRLERAIEESEKLTLFTVVNHADNAAKVGMNMRPTRLFVFGNPELGTPLMECGQSVAIDLPQKMLIWEDESGQVWVGYNDPEYLAERHGMSDCDETISRIKKALTGLAGKIAKGSS